ncbi:MAG: TPM domain-containing protein [Syntrophales bacterium]|nr:TPM domain-containing protein [Syntrophales bacterium]
MEMRVSRLVVLITVVLLLLYAFPAVSENFPKPRGAVNDFAGIIPADVEAKMELLAREVWYKTGTAIVVATVPTIGDEEINDYVNKLYSTWGIGKKGEDKGILIFVTLKERKLRIETGYGVEGILPDGMVGEIRDKYMIPYLRKGDYGTGLWNGMVAIADIVVKASGKSLSGDYRHAPQNRGVNKKISERGWNPWTTLLVLFILYIIFGTRSGRRVLPWLIIASLGSGRHYQGGFDSGFEGFSGGFGGFGGGMSGGGGAGGDF